MIRGVVAFFLSRVIEIKIVALIWFENSAIVFDMPPLLLTNEAQVLAAQAGQIVFVIEDRESSRDSVSRALGLLDREKPINAILNKSRSADISVYPNDYYEYYR